MTPPPFLVTSQHSVARQNESNALNAFVDNQYLINKQESVMWK